MKITTLNYIFSDKKRRTEQKQKECVKSWSDKGMSALFWNLIQFARHIAVHDERKFSKEIQIFSHVLCMCFNI